jgi:hypothetical protein
MSEETSKKVELQEQAKAVVDGTFATDKISFYKYVGKGLFLGVLGGLVYAVISGKDKFTCMVVGASIGGLGGYTINKMLKA